MKILGFVLMLSVFVSCGKEHEVYLYKDDNAQVQTLAYDQCSENYAKTLNKTAKFDYKIGSKYELERWRLASNDKISASDESSKSKYQEKISDLKVHYIGKLKVGNDVNAYFVFTEQGESKLVKYSTLTNKAILERVVDPLCRETKVIVKESLKGDSLKISEKYSLDIDKVEKKYRNIKKSFTIDVSRPAFLADYLSTMRADDVNKDKKVTFSRAVSWFLTNKKTDLDFGQYNLYSLTRCELKSKVLMHNSHADISAHKDFMSFTECSPEAISDLEIGSLMDVHLLVPEN
jgi:hypothetical protein